MLYVFVGVYLNVEVLYKAEKRISRYALEVLCSCQSGILLMVRLSGALSSKILSLGVSFVDSKSEKDVSASPNDYQKNYISPENLWNAQTRISQSSCRA